MGAVLVEVELEVSLPLFAGVVVASPPPPPQPVNTTTASEINNEMIFMQ